MLEICAELSANHNGSLERALKIVDAAADAGADLFKVQVWEPGTMCVDRSYVIPSGAWAGRRMFELYEEAWTPWEWLPDIFKRCRARGMEPFGAAFDNASVDYLESLGVKRHKVASFELVDLPLIRYMASKGKPVMLSTGMAARWEVQAAMAAALPNCFPLACVSAYPSRPEDVVLRYWADMFDDWGLSDHSLGCGVAAAAAALGATYIEKHLTLSRSDGGLDSGFSMEPAEFELMVETCHQAHDASQPNKRRPKPGGENDTMRRSLWVVKDTPAGARLVLGDNVRTARPASGLPCYTPLDGKCAFKDLAAGTPLTLGDIA
jgi:N-acetylneuraminate synthase